MLKVRKIRLHVLNLILLKHNIADFEQVFAGWVQQLFSVHYLQMVVPQISIQYYPAIIKS